MSDDGLNKIQLNEADLDNIENNLIDYLNRDDSPFKDYNFKTSVLSGLIRLMKFFLRNATYNVNRGISNLFLNTLKSEEALYSLIRNFSFIPQLNRPAKKYLLVKYNLTDAGYSASSGSHFQLLLNQAYYTDDYQIVPTLRDKWQETYYENANPDDFFNMNMFYTYMDLIEETGKDVLKTLIPVYQANWENYEEVVGASFTQEVDLKDSGGDYYNEKVIPETIRVFVKESGVWYEYTNARLGFFDENLRSFIMDYDKDRGVYLKFDVSHISRELQIGDTVRVFYAITQGDEINEVSGTNEFLSSSIEDIQMFEKYTDSTLNQIMVSNNKGGTLVPALADDYLTCELVDADEVLATLDNGVGKQDTESIKINAPYFLSTQGRAVTEPDFNYILKNKFVEYDGIKAWSGAREFIDVTELTRNKIVSELSLVAPNTYQGSGDDITSVVTAVLNEMYKEGVMTVKDVDFTSEVDGSMRRDVGFVYLTYYDKSFQFARNTLNDDEIVAFLDFYKILTIYFKFMNPNFTLIKPEITVTLNKAYNKSFSAYDLKLDIYNWINDNAKYQKFIDIKDLNSYLLDKDEISAVDSINFKAKIKVKNSTDFIFMRTFTGLKTPFSCECWGYVGGVYTYLGGEIEIGMNLTYLGGYTESDWDANASKGNLKFKTFDSSGNPLMIGLVPTLSEFYIEDVEFIGNKINIIRENVVGCESVDDVTLIVE